MGKDVGDGASWPGTYLGLEREMRFVLWVFKAHKSPEGGCAKDSQMAEILAGQ